MLQSYINPTILKPVITPKLAEEIIAKSDNWGTSSGVQWITLEYPNSQLEIIEQDKTTIVPRAYELSEIEKVKQDFVLNFNNESKYPKMNEEDWM